METKHHPLPWRNSENGLWVAGGGEYLGSMSTDRDNYKANAEFIVRACNGHYEFLGEIDRLRYEIARISDYAEDALNSQGIPSRDRWLVCKEMTRQALSAAIAKAEVSHV